MRSVLGLMLVFITVVGLSCRQTTKPAAVRFVNPPTLHQPTGLSHVVEVTRGRMIYVSGQPPLDRNGAVVGQGNLRAQSEQAFTNLGGALQSAGAQFSDVVKLDIYTTDLSQVRVLREVRGRYFTSNFPALTLVQVGPFGARSL